MPRAGASYPARVAVYGETRPRRQDPPSGPWLVLRAVSMFRLTVRSKCEGGIAISRLAIEKSNRKRCEYET